MRILIIFLLFISYAAADEHSSLSGEQWLKKVDTSMKTLNYHGTAVFMKNGQIETMKYQHTVDNGVETERLVSLNSPLRELIRKSNEVKCLYKDATKRIESYHPIDRSFIVNLPRAPEQLEEQYLVAVAGQEMIAIRPAQIIAVLPKDELRYARKIWVDKATWLPLKVEVYDQEGNTLEQVLFTEFGVDSAENPDINSVAEQRRLSRVAKTEAFENFAFELSNWPAGFEKVFFIRNTMQRSKKTVNHLLISDGFSNISVYFEEKTGRGVGGQRTLGPVNSFSRVIDDTQVTVLGEVPVQTVEFVAKGIISRKK